MNDVPADDLPAPDELAPDELALEALVRDDLRVDEPMPAEVWTRLSAALDAEAASRRRPRRGFAWPVGLAAAAVLVIAGAVLWPTLQSAPAPVAGEAPADVSAGVLAAEPPAAAADAPVTLSRSAPAEVAALEVTASGTDYTRANLDERVMAQLDAMQAANPRLLSTFETMAPDPTQTEGGTGFTASIDSLHGCIAAVTDQDLALFVDRATYQGQDVGIVVAMPQGNGFEVYVVRPDCSASTPAVILAVWLDPTEVQAPVGGSR